MVQVELYNIKRSSMEKRLKICKRKHCSNLSHICNHFQSIYTRTYLLGLRREQVYLDNSNLLPFDYLLKSILIVIPLIKAQFFYPLSTNSLYRACWAWIHSSYRNSVWTQSLQLAPSVRRTCVLVSIAARHGRIRSTSGKPTPRGSPMDRTRRIPATG